MSLGKLYLRAKHLASLGPLGLFFYYQKLPGLLSAVSAAEPRPCLSEKMSFEIHMLLSKECLPMGMWALHSFLSASERKDIGVLIHDDGSFDDACIAGLHRLFPGCLVVRRKDADLKMKAFFASRDLKRCDRLRDGLIFALKLFDVCVMRRCDSMLLLDCDVLFFEKPSALLKGFEPGAPQSLFMQDLNPNYYYSVSDGLIDNLAGVPVSRKLNPGIMKITGDALDFTRIERFLSDSSFWRTDGRPDYYAELTLWAMELARQRHAYLGPEYGFVYSDPGQALVACHYCGTFRIKTLDYGKSLLRLKRKSQSGEGLL